jgi:hypothetical protein
MQIFRLMTNNFPTHIEKISKWQEWKIPHIVVRPKSKNCRYIKILQYISENLYFEGRPAESPMVGAGVAPIAEEIYFRGLVFGYLRRWGPVAAILGSTLLFVAVHPDLQHIPFPQIVGGLLFALSYEIEKNLTRMLRAVGAEGEKPSATRLCVFSSDSVTSRL